MTNGCKDKIETVVSMAARRCAVQISCQRYRVFPAYVEDGQNIFVMTDVFIATMDRVHWLLAAAAPGKGKR